MHDASQYVYKAVFLSRDTANSEIHCTAWSSYGATIVASCSKQTCRLLIRPAHLQAGTCISVHSIFAKCRSDLASERVTSDLLLFCIHLLRRLPWPCDLSSQQHACCSPTRCHTMRPTASRNSDTFVSCFVLFLSVSKALLQECSHAQR